MKYLELFENWNINEAVDTDLELKSVAKKIFSVMKKYGLNPNYFSGDVKLDKANNSALILSEDKDTHTGLLTIKIWSWAIKDRIKELGNEITKIIGSDFENKSGEDFINNDKIYIMLIRKK